jgi:DNA-binding winged helix-turn-helix (wHTH) protein/predicted ATPase
MQWHFGPFRLDLANVCLWHAAQRVPLRPKTFEVLVYLVTHAGQLVTKDALFDAVWPETAVGDGVLKTSMTELRKVLGETAKAPQWIATVHRRGYRFLAPVTLQESTLPAAVTPAPVAPLPPPVLALVLPPGPVAAPTPAPRLVGREAEVATLHQWCATALQGERHLGFITGEAGIGKTTLVDTFVAQLAGQAPLWIGRGQCIEQYGAGEAYLPLLEALGQMGRTPDGPQLVALLRQQAPSWLLQLPALLPPVEYEALQRYAGGTTRERMLRELAEAMEALTAVRPCVLVLEDLHWSDTATIEWLAYVGRRRGPARLLVLGTYRPVEALVRAHPVHAMVQELTVHGYGAELHLREWSEAGVAAYLTQRGAGAAVPVELVRVLTQRTDGHPLFLVTVVDDLVRQGRLQVAPAGWVPVGGLDAVTGGVPQSIRHVLEHQVAQLPLADQELLAVASVAGVEFAVAAVAAGVQQAGEDVEVQCDALARRYQLVQARGTAVWPDGTVTARYGFRHALYQELLYERIPVSRRARWHHQIGMRLEEAFGPRAGEAAAELAVHFVHGRDDHRAVQYLQRAAETAVQRHAHREAIGYLTRALDLLKTQLDTPERAQWELTLLLALGPVVIAAKGYAAADVERVYSRAWQLCQHLGETSQLFQVLVGLRKFYQVRAAYQTAYNLGERLLVMAQSLHDPALLLEGRFGVGITLYYLGDFVASREQCTQGLMLYDTQQHRSRAAFFGQDTGVACYTYEALALWLLGYPDQALHRSREGLTLAQQLAHPFSLTFALLHGAVLHVARREGQATQEASEAALTLATEQGFAFWLAWGKILRGWALTTQGDEREGIAQMCQGLEATRSIGAEVGRSGFLALLAAAYGAAAQPEKGLEVLAEALSVVHNKGERYYEAEIHRLTGELLLAGFSDQQAASEASLHQALVVARAQQAKSWELRAAVSLGRLWQQQGKRTAARKLLEEVYGWFTEGFETADLQEAQGLLEELA